MTQVNGNDIATTTGVNEVVCSTTTAAPTLEQLEAKALEAKATAEALQKQLEQARVDAIIPEPYVAASEAIREDALQRYFRAYSKAGRPRVNIPGVALAFEHLEKIVRLAIVDLASLEDVEQAAADAVGKYPELLGFVPKLFRCIQEQVYHYNLTELNDKIREVYNAATKPLPLDQGIIDGWANDETIRQIWALLEKLPQAYFNMTLKGQTRHGLRSWLDIMGAIPGGEAWQQEA